MDVLLESTPLAEGVFDRGRRGGIYRVNRQLLRSLLPREDLHPCLSSLKDRRDESALRSLCRRSGIEEHFVDHEGLRRQRFTIFHSIYEALPDEAPAGRRVITIHDLIPLKRPECFVGGRAYAQSFQRILASIAPDDHVICVSEHTRQELLNHRPYLEERSLVIPLGVDDDFRTPRRSAHQRQLRRRYGIGDAPFMLTLSTLEPRKNIPFLLRCFAAIAEHPRLHGLHLVVTGEPGWLTDEIFRARGDLGFLRDRIHFTGFVADRDLPALYRAAEFFAFPSLDEGFGLPVLEAMACGTAVLASRSGSLPEVAGDAAEYLDPENRDSCIEGILRLADDPDHRSELGRRGRARSARFDWNTCARRHVRLYRQVVD